MKIDVKINIEINIEIDMILNMLIIHTTNNLIVLNTTFARYDNLDKNLKCCLTRDMFTPSFEIMHKMMFKTTFKLMSISMFIFMFIFMSIFTSIFMFVNINGYLNVDFQT